MEFKIWSASDNYKDYDFILQKWQLKIITTKEKNVHSIIESYIQERTIIINDLGELMYLQREIKHPIILKDLTLCIYDDYLE